MENIWGITGRDREVAVKTNAEITRHSHDVWESIRGTPDMCSKLVGYLPLHLQQVIEAERG